MKELFKDTSSGKVIVVTVNGVGVSMTTTELLEIERLDPDFKFVIALDPEENGYN